MSTPREAEPPSASVLAAVGRARILPVLVVDDPDRAGPLAAALSEGGLRLAEITFRTSAALEVPQIMARRPGFVVGAGTVISPRQVDDAAAAGARFVVWPGLSLDVVRRCQKNQIPVFSGVATATELMAAVNAGLAHPAVLAVGGSWTATPALIADGRWSEITRLTAAAVAAGRPASS